MRPVTFDESDHARDYRQTRTGINSATQGCTGQAKSTAQIGHCQFKRMLVPIRKKIL
ncbi:hypothetical protein SJ05684_c13660 [Sinorhizobium sojae CCBAU 05684]|uniref:Uncharacterized protein n=1 Tax=Sinorhizobium sojae CCBAU 05684 TaxID=716928 RepID=A0A249PAA3_9HYPH|nr:hypothetical protein SJ05684_c13660 [Sinorhizobium sojae CCBAU 05684]